MTINTDSEFELYHLLAGVDIDELKDIVNNLDDIYLDEENEKLYNEIVNCEIEDEVELDPAELLMRL